MLLIDYVLYHINRTHYLNLEKTNHLEKFNKNFKTLISNT